MMLSALLKLHGWFSLLLNGGNSSTNLKELLRDLNELVAYKSSWTDVHLIVNAQKCVYYLKDDIYLSCDACYYWIRLRKFFRKFKGK